MAPVTTVTVKMYNVGFGDAFLVTVDRGSSTWRAVIDCGVHSHGRYREPDSDRRRGIEEVVAAMIADLKGPQPVASVDVIVATHHHADHVVGFASDQWRDVTVGEVWVPYVEDPDDETARVLRAGRDQAAQALLGVLSHRLRGLDRGRWPDDLALAEWFAANSSGNEKASRRLLGLDPENGFANRPHVRYLPSKDAGPVERITTALEGVTVDVLGPSRDPRQIKRMEPPKRVAWLQLDQALRLAGQPPADEEQTPLFGPRFRISERKDMGDLEESSSETYKRYRHLTEVDHALAHLEDLDGQELLAAASILEGAVNNTSLFFVLSVGDHRLLFPGDAQQGAWDHVMADPEARELITGVDFFKISHHGSHNGTPRPWVEGMLQEGALAMLPYGVVPRWKDSIPKPSLLDALSDHHQVVVRADQPEERDPRVTIHGDLATEITFTVGP